MDDWLCWVLCFCAERRSGFSAIQRTFNPTADLAAVGFLFPYRGLDLAGLNRAGSAKQKKPNYAAEPNLHL